MTCVVGIDEVGYGPRLGPFIVCAVALNVPSVDAPLGDFFREAGLDVRDSKKVFSQARGIGTLEPSALAFCSQRWPLQGLTHARLWSHLSSDPRRSPWYGDLPLPFASKEIPSKALRRVLTRNQTRVAGAWASILEPAGYNARVGGNKAGLLFDCSAALMKRARKRCPGPLHFFIGKQGGRNRYHGPLSRHFNAPMIREESHERSTYEIGSATVTYLIHGEDRHPLIALASILGKYLRELSMKLFNAYWMERLPIRPTAGYGTDGLRFFHEIEPYLKTHNLAVRDILRSR